MRLPVFVVALAGAVLGTASSQQLPAGFELQTVMAPLAFGHVAFDFLPDGRILLIHKDSGEVSLWRSGDTAPTVVYVIPDVRNESERGLLGLAVDPAWPTRPYLYFYHNHVSGLARVVLYEAVGDLTDPTSLDLTLTNPYVLLADIPDAWGNHKGGTLRFAPSGELLVSTGDDDSQCPAQDLTSLLGKLLRLDVSQVPQPGSGPPAKSLLAPADNPFPGPDENERLVYALGLRNPFRFDVDSVTGEVLLGDVGSLEWEEIDALASDAVERNFGWPLREGDEPHPTYGDLICGPDSIFANPIFQYERGTQSAAVIGGVMYRDPAQGFPDKYDGDFFFYDFRRHTLRRLVKAQGVWELASPVVGQPTNLNWGQDLGATSCFRVGPEGAIYFLNFRSESGQPDAGLYRIVQSSVVSAPLAPVVRWEVRIAPNPSQGSAGFAFSYQLSGDRAMRLRIFDAAGRLLRTVKHRAAAGDAFSEWDGRTEQGRLAPAGTYFYVLDDGDGMSARGKLTILQ